MENEQIKQQQEGIAIDLLELFNVLLKRWKFIARYVLIGLVIGIIYCLVASPRYESTALLRVKQSKAGLDNFNSTATVMGGGYMAEQQVATYTEILTSHSVIDPVIAQMAADFPELPPEKQVKFGTFVKEILRVEAVKQTDLLKVITAAKTPEYAQKINEYVLTALQEKLISLGRVEQRSVSKFLKQRSADAKEELTVAENKLSEFLAKSKIYTPDARADFLSEQLTKIDALIAENEIAESISQSKLKAVNAQLAAAGMISVAANQTTESIQKAITELEVERISYLDKYTDKHPRLQEIHKQIAALKKKLNVEINRVIQLKAPSKNTIHQKLIGSKLQAEAELSVINNKKQVLAKLSERNNKDIEKLPLIGQEYLQVKRRCDLASEIYTLLAKKYEESQIAEAMEVGDVQIIDQGDLPEKPVAPRKMRVLLVCMFWGGFLSAGLITLQFVFNTTIKTEDDVVKYLELPVLGSIPEERSLAEAMQANKRTLLEKLLLGVFRYRAIRGMKKWKK